MRLSPALGRVEHRPPGPDIRPKFVRKANVAFTLGADHPPMTRPQPSSKVLLVEDRRADSPEPASDGAVRRYRLARLRFDSRPSSPEARFEHLKRVYD